MNVVVSEIESMFTKISSCQAETCLYNEAWRLHPETSVCIRKMIAIGEKGGCVWYETRSDAKTESA